MFDSPITGDETRIHFYEPKRKIDNRIWALKHAKRLSIAKRTLTAARKEGVICHFSSEILGHSCQLLFQKVGVSGSFYKIVVLKKKNAKKMRKVRPKTVSSMSIVT